MRENSGGIWKFADPSRKFDLSILRRLFSAIG